MTTRGLTSSAPSRAAGRRRVFRGDDRRGAGGPVHRIDADSRSSGLQPDRAVRGQRGRPDLLHRAAATRAGGGAGRRHARRGWCRVSGFAPQPAGDALHARRLRPARRSARCSPSRSARGCRLAASSSASLVGALARGVRRVSSGQCPPAGAVHHGAPARGRDAERVLFGADSVRAVPQRFRADVSRAAVADGRPRRRRATGRSSRRCRSSRSRSSDSPGWPGR